MGVLELEAGAVIGDGRCSYRLGRLIGEGGMGHVWEATDEATGKPVALKVLKGAKAEDRKRFLREMRAAAAIQHPSVITVHDFIELPSGVLAIVMDLLEGETLGAILRRDARIALPDLAAILLPVLSALEAAHALGIIHRDLKPDNVFVCRAGSGLDVKVLDFGVAKLTASDGLAAQTQALTGTGSMVGTPYYMSPEQVFADKDLDARSDIWSIGVIVYECLTGVRPTEADTVGRVLKRIMVADFEPITTHRADLPEDVVGLVGRILSVNREHRPQRLAEIREILERHAGEGLPSFSQARSVPPVDPHATTVLTPDAAPRAPASVRQPVPAGKLLPPAGPDTSDPVSLLPRPSPATRRVAFVLSLAAVGAIGGTVVLRATSDRARTTTAVVGVQAAESTSAPSPVAKEVPSALAMAAPSSSPVETATAVSAASPPRASAPAANARPPATPRADAAAGIRCEAREVLSNGHCCPLGLVWQFERCERPFATTF